MKQRLIDYANSKGHTIQSITDQQLKNDLVKLFPAEFFFKTKQLTVKKMAALVLSDMVEPVCECCGASVSDRFPWKPSQTTTERTTEYGAWARTCSASCNQKLIEREGNRTQTFIERFGSDNPMKNPDVAKKAIDNRNTDWEKVGIEQQKRRLITRGVSNEFINSVDFASDESKAAAIIRVAEQMTVELGREPFRREIADRIGMHYVMIHRWLRTPETQHLYIDASISQQQMEVFEFVKSLGIECVLSDRTQIAPFEIDIYIPSHNIGIEYHGIWNHSEGYGKDSTYHLTKTEMAESKGINLLQIYDVEWLDDAKREIWKSIIRHKLGMITTKIHARKTTLRTINSSDARKFLEQNHLNGFVRTTNHIGLFHDDHLVSVLSFGKSRFDGSTEIIRMATMKDTIVVGGVTKLFSYVKKTTNWITCFSDRRYASQTHCAYWYVMKYAGNSPPNWYAFESKEYELRSRFQFMRHKVKERLGDKFDDEKTTFENMLINGYDRIWDSGNLKYVWESDRLFHGK